MAKETIKAAAKGYTNSPFYLLQKQASNQRYVISAYDKRLIEGLYKRFVNDCEAIVSVKIRDLDNPDFPVEYTGELEKVKLKVLLKKHEEVFFHHGFHEFMIHNPRSKEDFVFDEHGLVFIYTASDYSSELEQLGIEFKPSEKLIYQAPHWHVCLAEGQERLNDMIADMELERNTGSTHQANLLSRIIKIIRRRSS